jgi:hypothetical protein
MAPSTQHKYKTIKEILRKCANFSNCTGDTDGKYVRVITPADRDSLFCNNYFSVALLGVFNSNYQFTFVDIGSYGRSDLSTFKNSLLCKKHKQIFSTFHQGVLVGTDGPILPNVLIRDEAFKLLSSTVVCRVHFESSKINCKFSTDL